MKLLERVVWILATPKAVWHKINTESGTISSLLVKYLVPLALISVLPRLLVIFFSFGPFMWCSVWQLFIQIIITLLVIVLSFYIIDAFSGLFQSYKSLNRSARLLIFSYTPVFIAGFLSVIPFISWLLSIAGWLYFIYLFYLGLGPLKRTPENKKIFFTVVAFLVVLVLQVIALSILTPALTEGLCGNNFSLK